MKIAVIGIRGVPANYGGFETCAEYVSKYWAKEGNDVLIYCRKHHYPKQLDSFNGCRLKYTGSIRIKSLDTLSHTLFSILDLIINERSIHCVHLYNAGNAMYIPILRLMGKKIAISVDGIEWKREKWGWVAKLIHKLGERLAVKYAHKVIVDNKAVEKYYVNKYGKSTSLIPYGAKIPITSSEDEEILGRYGLAKQEYFIFVGRLVPEKGVHNLIDVYKKLNTSHPLVIVGDDVSMYRDELLQEQSDKIIFVGYVYGENYEVLLMNSLIYVSASQLEGTSPSLLAAMGAGVCTLVNGIAENLYTIEDSGYAFAENDLEIFYKVWSDLLIDKQKIQYMAAKGRTFVLRKYQWENISRQYIELFEDMLGDRSTCCG